MKKKIAIYKEKIKQLEEENARLCKNIKNLAEQTEQAELILYKAWVNSGEENAQIEKAGRMLLNAYMPIKSFDEFWKISPSHYDHVDLASDMAKRAFSFRKFARIKRAASASEAYTDWEIAKDLPLEEIACRLKEGQMWDLGLLRELCRRAGMLREWQEADAAAFERIAAIVAKKLGADIGIQEDMFQKTAESDEDDTKGNETEK